MITLRQAIAQRRLLLDGAMGSLIQEYHLTEQDFRGEQFRDWKVNLKGNNDVLVLTRPDVISDIHRKYLEAGADLITTCTFSSQIVSQQEYQLTEYVDDLNRAGARLARAEADRMTALTPSQPRFVIGDIGPTSRMLSMSEDVNNPAMRAITFDALEDAFAQQMRVLIEEGVDAILLETLFDTLNAKAAISAYQKVMINVERDVPLMLSLTISDASGRLLSGQTVEGFVSSVGYCEPLSIGMNCGYGAATMLQYLRQLNDAVCELSHCSPYITCHPNAGLPNDLGEYDDTPEIMVEQMRPFLTENLADVIGGCCGTTPAHIAAMRKLLDEFPHQPTRKRKNDITPTVLSGLERFAYETSDFVVVGERCNVAGSRKFLRLISEKNYDEALDIARKQVQKGAMVIDVNMDDGMLDARTEMRTFLNLLASDPSICRVPIMVDSSRFDVIEEGLKCCQGKCVVNSISLKSGEKQFIEQAKVIKRLGAAVIVMCFDEDGQATDYQRRVDICRRAYNLLVNHVGFHPEDIIFDLNVLTIATGMAEHANYAADFIRAAKTVTDEMPGVRISGGLSNLSFAFRGNNYLREAMHSVFLYHAKQNGMNMAIMNPATAVKYEDIPTELRDTITEVILNTSATATERLTEMAQDVATSVATTRATTRTTTRATAPTNPVDRLSLSLIAGTSATLQEDIISLIQKGLKPLDIISGPLMQGMNEVGRLFGKGEMFLPQVVKTARTMKQAVDILEPYMKEDENKSITSAGKILIATVKGDVHDIGKNIVAVVLACNGFEVIDLGVMVPAETIVEEAIKNKVDIVCLSGLITPSLDEMCHVAEAMQAAGLNIPLFVGGATTSLTHTAMKISRLYRGGVFHLRDASQDPVLALSLLDPTRRKDVLKQNDNEQNRIRLVQQQKEQRRKAEFVRAGIDPDAASLANRFTCDWQNYLPTKPPYIGESRRYTISVDKLIPHIDWLYFYWAWRVKEDSEEGRLLRADANALLNEMAENKLFNIEATAEFFEAKGAEDSIKITTPNGIVSLPTIRQPLITAIGERRAQCLSLCDFVSPMGNDHIGVFAATMGKKIVERLESLKNGDDDYAYFVMQTICDRLADAASEYLANIFAQKGWNGIRPAIGYPSLPDQKLMFTINKLIDLESIGITLTENGAMYPQSSVAAIAISHPDAKYF